MKQPNPKDMSFDRLQKWAFRWPDCAESDRKYFLIQIARYVRSKRLQNRVDFRRFMRHHIWLRNKKGRTIKYMHFSEKYQTIGFCMYFKAWMHEALGQIMDYAADAEIESPAPWNIPATHS